MTKNLGTHVTEYFDCAVRLSESRLDAQQLREFADTQMPRTGLGAVPWSTPLSSDQLTELADSGKAEFVTARMMLAADAEPPLIGIGALIRDPDRYPTARMIIVVESQSRGQGTGIRIAKDLINLLHPGETVQVEVQQANTNRRRVARFFENLGFECVNENYRTGEVPEYKGGVMFGSVQRQFALYAFTKPA